MGGHICPWWLAYTFDNPFRNFIHNPGKILGPYVDKGMTVLDVGCGMGFFSIGLARLVGDKGCVIAADVQPQMLRTLEKRSEKAGVSNIIRPHRSEPDKLGVSTPVDFILAFWMVHEVPDADMFFHQVRSCLKPNGRILVAEPRFHVSLKRFQEILVSAQKSGLIFCEAPYVRFSRSAVMNCPG
ncbi:MAG: class I SAM-dependent methyltransferase [Thermodesulfovibrionia bacterium]|nr:class I SAM-dependent methyltransferase [Thermodesulfovibrionia bacterium]